MKEKAYRIIGEFLTSIMMVLFLLNIFLGISNGQTIQTPQKVTISNDGYNSAAVSNVSGTRALTVDVIRTQGTASTFVTGGTITANPSTRKTLDTGNSTSIPLSSRGTFTGTWTDTTNFVQAIIGVTTDQNAATNGLRFEVSDDGINTDHFHSFTPIANYPVGHHYPNTLDSKYFRVIYTNGTSTQSYFHITTTLLTNSAEEGHVHPINYVIDNDHPSPINRSILVARNPSGDYDNIGRTAGGNLKVSIEEQDPGAGLATEATLTAIAGNQTNGLQKTKIVSSNGLDWSFQQTSSDGVNPASTTNIPAVKSFNMIYNRGTASFDRDTGYSNSSSATVSSITASTVSQTLLSSSNARKMWMMYSDGGTLYLKFGINASLTSYSVQVPSGSTYSSPITVYTGTITGIWSVPTGTAMVTTY